MDCRIEHHSLCVKPPCSILYMFFVFWIPKSWDGRIRKPLARDLLSNPGGVQEDLLHYFTMMLALNLHLEWLNMPSLQQSSKVEQSNYGRQYSSIWGLLLGFHDCLREDKPFFLLFWGDVKLPKATKQHLFRITFGTFLPFGSFWVPQIALKEYDNEENFLWFAKNSRRSG